MKGYVGNIESEAMNNDKFRRVIYTGEHAQVVVMSIAPGEDIGMEVHDVDQFIRIESGTGVAVIDTSEHPVSEGYGILVPAGSKHNIRNTSGTDFLKIYSIYAPPQHKDGTVHVTKTFASAHEESFDGHTSE